ncbi:MAG: magnesium-translocating P-type ATPase [Deltaproteobacteria bacterium]|nr:magnesium-translocating P-type ATPase [Deltaproteobacteria bacterium]
MTIELPIDDLLARLSTSPRGLEDAEAAARLSTLGPNELEPPRQRTLVFQIVRRLVAPLTAILVIAAGISAFAGERESAVLIMAIVAASVGIETAQSERARRTIDLLREHAAPKATVLRSGQTRSVARREVVPGDILELDAGDLVSADCRLLAAKDLHVQQAALTGESMPVERAPITGALRHASPADGDGVLFAGTSVVSGHGAAVAVTTGRSTMFGEIAAQLARRLPSTEFDRGVARFGVLILETVLVLVVLVLGAGIAFRRNMLESLLFAVALAVGLTPEFLPMITSVTLASAARHMAKRGVIVKQLAAIQNLGSIDVLCTDKTGTLTTGEMTFSRAVDATGAPSEHVLLLGCTNSHLGTGIGNALDVALRRALPCPAHRKLDEIPFDFERRCATVVVDDGTGPFLITKGAPEQVLARCGGQAASRAVADRLSDDGSRVLAVATRRIAAKASYTRDDEHDLDLAGFLVFDDPIEPDVADAVAALHADGVDVKIVTGDSDRVARSVCARAGLAFDDVLTGDELDRLTDPALSERALHAQIFARVTPMQKRRIIGALSARGRVVGFLGDGINDAPSLRAADVGISVAGAVDVARDAADIVLTKHDLRVLHAGILEGRRALGNVMKYLLMETSSNFGNMLSMAVASLLLPFLPMLPVQVLLNNFLYDIAQLTIPTDRVDNDFLRAPRRWDIAAVRRFMLQVGPLSSIFDLLTFAVLLYVFHATAALFHTGWFVESVVTQILVLFIIRKLGSGPASVPSRAIVISSVIVVAVAVALPYTPLAATLGFVALPAALVGAVAVTVIAYLVLVRLVRARAMRALRLTPAPAGRAAAPRAFA